MYKIIKKTFNDLNLQSEKLRKGANYFLVINMETHNKMTLHETLNSSYSFIIFQNNINIMSMPLVGIAAHYDESTLV